MDNLYDFEFLSSDELLEVNGGANMVFNPATGGFVSFEAVSSGVAAGQSVAAATAAAGEAAAAASSSAAASTATTVARVVGGVAGIAAAGLLAVAFIPPKERDPIYNVVSKDRVGVGRINR